MEKKINFNIINIFKKILLLFLSIFVSIISITIITTIIFIIILFIKPIPVSIFNDYIYNKINKIEETSLNFDLSNATFYLRSLNNLEYTINNFDLTYNNTNINFSKITININPIKLIFKNFIIYDVDFYDGNLDINIKKNYNENDNKNDNKNNNDYIDTIKKAENLVIKALKNHIIIKKFTLKDFKINFLMDNKIMKSSIKKLNLDIDIQNNDLVINQYSLFNINDNKTDSKLKINCTHKNKNQICNLYVDNIDFDDYKIFVNENDAVYEYLNNIKGLFDVNLDFVINKKFEFDSGNIKINSKNGSFYLKSFFEEKINFKDLNININFKDNFKIIALDSLNAYLDDMDFNMKLFFNNKEEYNELIYNFNINQIPLKNLNKFWPVFLGEEDVRPWVIEHITDGTSPHATATINMRYYKNEKDKYKSGLHNVYSEVEMDNVLLNYSDYFPVVKNINGLAIFTKNIMDIKLNSGDVLSTKIENGNIFMDFKNKIKDLIIEANVKGPISDLFVHINKEKQKIIEDSVNTIISDYYTNTKLYIDIPIINNIDFNKVEIKLDSNILNKKNFIFYNNANILLSFIKNKNSDIFSGKINLTNSDIEFLPLNIYKPSKTNFGFDYEAVLKDSIIYITKFNPTTNFIKFNIDGFIDLDKKIQNIDIDDIKYNNSNYNIHYNSYVSNDILHNNIDINGNNINYENIFNKLKKTSTDTKNNTDNKNNTNIENNITLKLNYLSFSNDKKLNTPLLTIKTKNNNIDNFDFSAIMTDKNYIKSNYNKKTKLFNFVSNNFGEFFNTIDLTDKVKNGSGEININTKNINGKNVIVGNLKIDKEFSIIPDENVKQNVLSDDDIKDDKNFKKLKKGLKKDTKITFDKLKGEFSYSDDILKLNEIVASSKFIYFQVVLSGFINIKTGEIDLNGLFVPLSIVNSLFGANKLPLIGELIFGGKDNGLFASKFTIIKKDSNDKVNIDIDKFSIILPGFLRNIFDISSWIK